MASLFKTLLIPTNDLLPYLMVEVCLVLLSVLAPDVKPFLHANRGNLVCAAFSFFLRKGHIVGHCSTCFSMMLP